MHIPRRHGYSSDDTVVRAGCLVGQIIKPLGLPGRFMQPGSGPVLPTFLRERRGGTAVTVQYAQKMGRKIIVIDPITRLISHCASASALQ